MVGELARFSNSISEGEKTFGSVSTSADDLASTLNALSEKIRNYRVEGFDHSENMDTAHHHKAVQQGMQERQELRPQRTMAAA